MEDLGIPLLPDWPARSPDLSIIEHVWKIFKDALEGLKFDKMYQFWAKVEEEVFAIPDQKLLIYIEQSPIKLKLL